MEASAKLSKELRAVLVAGFHNLMCHYSEVILEGPKAGRAKKVGLPAYGSAECVCHDKVLKYNGVVI